jgi:hypothetical protein
LKVVKKVSLSVERLAASMVVRMADEMEEYSAGNLGT